MLPLGQHINHCYTLVVDDQHAGTQEHIALVQRLPRGLVAPAGDILVTGVVVSAAVLEIIAVDAHQRAGVSTRCQSKFRSIRHVGLAVDMALELFGLEVHVALLVAMCVLCCCWSSMSTTVTSAYELKSDTFHVWGGGSPAARFSARNFSMFRINLAFCFALR